MEFASSYGSMMAGMITGKKNRTFLVLVIGSCLMVIGAACLSTLSNTIDVQAKTYGFQVFMGLGFGLTVATSSIVSPITRKRTSNLTYRQLATIECELRDHGTSPHLCCLKLPLSWF